MQEHSWQGVLFGTFSVIFLLLVGCTSTTTNNVQQNHVTQQIVVVSPPGVSGQNPAILPAGEIGTCSLEAKLNAVASTQPIAVTFQNQTGADITLFWLDYNGHRKAYGTIETGKSRLQQTFVTHPWVVGDSSGKCLEIVMPGRLTQTVVVKNVPVTAAPPASTHSP
jgi:hypothetical protein